MFPFCITPWVIGGDPSLSVVVGVALGSKDDFIKTVLNNIAAMMIAALVRAKSTLLSSA